jgi:hypothetical protein
MTMNKTVEVMNECGQVLKVYLEFDGERESAILVVDSVRYHFERITRDTLASKYTVDLDPDYSPQSDEYGYCYMLAPFCE